MVRITKSITGFLIVIVSFLILFYYWYNFQSEKIINMKLKHDITYELNNNNDTLVTNDIIINTKQNVFKLASEVEKKIISNQNNAKIAYITFDDGPYALTDKFLDILKKYKVKATFFTIGLGKERCYDNSKINCTEMYKKITDANHTIANHTYSHKISNGIYNNTNEFIVQVKKQENLIKEKTGVITNIVRFPGGSASARGLKNSIINELSKMNYGWVDWTALDGDGNATAPTVSQALNTFKNSINEKIEVVLLHDYNYTTLQILPNIIEYLQNNNYIILPLFYESVKINK